MAGVSSNESSFHSKLQSFQLTVSWKSKLFRNTLIAIHLGLESGQKKLLDAVQVAKNGLLHISEALDGKVRCPRLVTVKQTNEELVLFV